MNDTERQLRSLLAETAPARPPEHLRDAIVAGTASVRQRPGWLARTRLGPSEAQGAVDRNSSRRARVRLVAVMAILAALGAGAILLRGIRQDSVTASPAQTATTPPASPTGPVPAVPAQLAVQGSWLADVPAVAAIGHQGGRMELAFEIDPSTFVGIKRSDSVFVVQSESLNAAPGEIRLRARGILGCDRGQEGRYGFARSSDGLFLTLTPIEDECDLRASILRRTWVRSHGAVSDGRRELLAAFSPAIVVDLPGGRWRTDQSVGLAAVGAPSLASLGEAIATVEEGGVSLAIVKNPLGFADPCRPVDLADPELQQVRRTIQPTISAFAAYLATLPGFALASEDGVVGGYPARHISVATDPGVTCSGGTVAAFTSPGSKHVSWSVISGDAASIWLVQVDSDLYLFYYRDAIAGEEARLLSTIEFVTGLPTP